MSGEGRDLADRFYERMAAADLAGLVELYAPDAMIIRFDGASVGSEEISAFLAEVLTRHQPYVLHSIDQVMRAGDVVMWDAVVDTSKGFLETTEVIVLDEADLIKRQIPGIRGYWGS